MVDNNRALYVADTRNSRIVKWLENAKAGTVIGGGNGAGNRTDQLSYPDGIFLDRATNTVYVADTKNSRVVRIPIGAQNAPVIIAGGNGYGSAAHQLSSPHGLASDSKGSLYVSDRENNRVQMFACSNGGRLTISLYFLALIISTIIISR
jgi:sugar lactone lactonase YvrE